MKDSIRSRFTSRKSWILPKQESSLAPPNVWTNKDNDVTPPKRRTWSTWTILGFWFSDAMNIQGWEQPSSVIAVGLTWREALYTSAVGMLTVSIPLVFNGAIGANLHVPFPVAIRISFGYYFSRFAIVIRLITAFFWHSIQTYTGSWGVTCMIAAIWPSYLHIHNTIPANIGITSQQMVSHLVFWVIQLPILLIPPHKLRLFFVVKAVVVVACCAAIAAGMVRVAGGDTGNIFNQTAQVQGQKKNWLILNAMSAASGGWATMATNISDFTRYSKTGNGVYLQAIFLPCISLYLAACGIIGTSAGQLVYGSYVWDPNKLALEWTGAGGRAAMFFVGFSWAIAQIGTNLSANVITGANDLTSLFPKYINIKRGVVITTIIGGWVMQPWEIISSAQSLLTFMSGLAVFLAPIASIQASDFWLVKKRKVDVPALYDPNGIYRYWNGINWRAAVAFIIGLTPNLPGLAKAVNSSIQVSEGILHVYDINYIFGLFVTAFVYVSLSYLFPHRPTLLSQQVLIAEATNIEILDKEDQVPSLSDQKF